MSQNNNDPLLEMYIFETNQLIEKLEEIILNSEKNNTYKSDMDEIFRIMHTIKGNSAMMLFDNISTLAHSVEDLFDYLRKSDSLEINYSEITDIVLQSIDFMKVEVEKIQNCKEADGNSEDLIELVESKIDSIKNSNKSTNQEQVKKEDDNSKLKYYIGSDNKNKSSEKEYEGSGKLNSYKAIIKFDDDCQMENVRAFTVIHNLKDIAKDISYYPEDIIESDESSEIIKNKGFTIYFKVNKSIEDAKEFIFKTSCIDSVDIKPYDEGSIKSEKPDKINNTSSSKTNHIVSNVLSVNVDKMDKLMDLVGELVVSESMVTGSSDLEGLELENFNKSARQLRKIINDLQDVVMDVRMMPIAPTFLKMNRIVRDMCKNLSKEVDLELIGEETEVDKNIIEGISDPLMHLVRNSMDHGIESAQERLENGKSKKGKITLQAKNEGGDVWITVKDDGKGLDKVKIYDKAFNNGLTDKNIDELTDKEIYSYILLPGFTTNEAVTEYSGRGVGMDVVCKNIDKIRGTTIVDSIQGKGTTISIKIPLTLAIIDGMLIQVGNTSYTIPTISIKQSFKLKEKNLIVDPDGNEMVMVRGECYPLIKLYKIFHEETKVKNVLDGIIIMIENGGKSICLLADELIGQQQVVIKSLPLYIKKTKGIAGCTLLGNGEISLILDVSALIN